MAVLCAAREGGPETWSIATFHKMQQRRLISATGTKAIGSGGVREVKHPDYTIVGQ